MLAQVLEALLLHATNVLEQTAIQEHVSLRSVSIFLSVVIVLLAVWIRFLTKAPKTFRDRQIVLPDEVLISIFQHSSIKDLKASAQACRHFDRVTKDEKLWRAFCQRDFDVDARSERPVWAASWHDFYVYQFKAVTSLNLRLILWKYWQFFLRKNGYHLQAFTIAFSPLLLAGLVILFVHILYDNPASAIPDSSVNGNGEAFETASWSVPNWETCTWIMLIKIATFLLARFVIPIVGYCLSWLEPLFLKPALHLFSKDDDSWKYYVEHKSTTVLLGATLLSVTLFSAVVALLTWRLVRFARSEWRQRRVKFLAKLKKGWDEVEKRTKMMNKRLRSELKRQQQRMQNRQP